ncbi:MAG: sensor histidine kinase [Actinomycetota bacterium]
MASITRLVLGWGLVSGFSAIGLSLLGPWGRLAALAVIVVATLALATSLRTRYGRPLEELRTTLPHRTDVPAAELASIVAAEQRRANELIEQASAEARRRQAALAHAADGVLIVDPAGFVEYANPTARAFLNDRVLNVTRRLGQPDLERVAAQSQLEGAVVAEDVTLWTPAAKPARARAVPLGDGSIIVLLSDLSESYRLDQVRRDFVANVSHELKTPVAAIRALAETAATALASGDLDTATRFVERLGMESARLAGLVTDLLDLSRVEAGGAIQASTVEIDAVLAEAADRARPVAEVKAIDLVVHRSGMVVEADASQLSMAVKNLVDNAVRYSESGKIELEARRTPDGVAVAVADQGIGIPADEVPRVFERFYRVDKARSRVTGGTGLGLAIVRHVAENHGGRVDVETELGVGSKFTLVLPARREPNDNGAQH